MGKAKNKKTKQAAVMSPILESHNLEVDLPSSLSAMDGHNTQGWSDNEIRAYNELILERTKLEKQRHDLEEKCTKSQTHRALLHEHVANIDSVFKMDKHKPGFYKYIGFSNCCVDQDLNNSSCDHELCTRAKSEGGVHGYELDLIKRYSERLRGEKSDRMRSALRKQRDLELIRLKEEGERKQTMKKSTNRPQGNQNNRSEASGRITKSRDVSRAAKETEEVVNNIINQLDDLRADLQTGKISAEEAQGKLNILDGKLPAIQDKTGEATATKIGISSTTKQEVSKATSSFQNLMRDRLLGVKGNTFSQAFSIMDHFLSATKPDDLQDAISDLKEVLKLSGPMCDELQTSLGALEGIFDNPDKLSFTGPDGKQECTSIIDLMEKLKDALQRTGQLSDGANASLTKVFQDCIDLENDALKQLFRKCTDGTVTSATLPTILTQMKEEFVGKSPIPPLTSSKLNREIAVLIDTYDAGQLLAQAKLVAKPTELEAILTSLVISRTQKQSTKYVKKLEDLRIVCENQGLLEQSDNLRDAITSVSNKMKKWVPAIDAKESNKSIANGKSGSKDVRLHGADHSTTHAFTTAVQASTYHQQLPPTNGRQSKPHDQMPTLAQENRRQSLQENANNDLWTAFAAYKGGIFAYETDQALLDKAESYKSMTRALVEDATQGVYAAVLHLYRLKLCPGLVAAIVSMVLLSIAKTSEEKCRLYIKQLSGCIGGLSPVISEDWSQTFQYLALAMIQVYVGIYVETMHAFPNRSPLYFAISSMEMTTKSVLLTRAADMSTSNLGAVTEFTLSYYSKESSKNLTKKLSKIPSLLNALSHYRHFAVNDRFRCLTTNPCPKHMIFARMPFKPSSTAISTASGPSKVGTPASTDYAIDSATAKNAAHATDMDHISNVRKDTMKSVVPIRPRKTMASYPPNFELEAQDEASKDELRTRIFRKMMQGTADRESAARKSLAILYNRANEFAAKKTLPPAQMFIAMDQLLNNAWNEYYHPLSKASSEEVPLGMVVSKFSEDLDKPDQWHQAAVDDVLKTQNIFKQIKTGYLGQEYLESIKKDIREASLSGKYRCATDMVDLYLRNYGRIGSMPDSMRKTFLQAREEIKSELEGNGQAGILEHETRRLRFLLQKVDAEEPSASALLKLASQHPSAFQEYCDEMTNTFCNNGSDTAEQVSLALLWVNITELAKDDRLEIDSKELLDLAGFAIEDWKLRPREITNYVSDGDDASYFSYDEEDHELVMQALTDTEHETPMLGMSPAKQPMLESSSSRLSNVASQATWSSYEEQDDSVATSALSHQIEVQASSDGDVSRNIEGDNFKHPQTELEIEQSIKADASTVNDHVEAPQTPTLDSESESKPTLSSNDTDPSTYTPAELRMLEMLKWLKKLHKNRADMLDTSGHAALLSTEHGRCMQSVTDKLVKQIESYTEFVLQIAEWNELDLAKLGYHGDEYANTGPK